MSHNDLGRPEVSRPDADALARRIAAAKNPSAELESLAQRTTEGDPHAIPGTDTGTGTGSSTERRRIGPYLIEGDLAVPDPSLTALNRAMWGPLKAFSMSAPRRRIVLLGESVARGFFFDPEWSPAAVLSSCLPEAEIIDLARSDLSAAALIGLLDRSAELDADHLCVWAGNNWLGDCVAALHPDVASSIDLSPMALRPLAHEALTRVSEQVAEAIARAARHTPITVVVPAVNLAGFRFAQPFPVPWMGSSALSEDWLRRLEELRSACADDDRVAAAAAAGQLRRIDQGTCSVGPELLGHLLLRCGEQRTAADAFNTAVDAELWRGPRIPRCPEPVRTILRATRSTSINVVDLHELLGPLPDPDLFLDYCHHSVKGVLLAVGHIVRGLGDHPAQDALCAPPPNTRARAQIAAAVYAAALGQPKSTIRSHLRDVPAETDPGWLRDHIDDWLSIIGLGLPRVLLPGGRRAVATDDVWMLARMVNLGGSRYPHLRRALADLRDASGNEARRGSGEFDDLTVPEDPVDLLTPEWMRSDILTPSPETRPWPVASPTLTIELPARRSTREVKLRARSNDRGFTPRLTVEGAGFETPPSGAPDSPSPHALNHLELDGWLRCDTSGTIRLQLEIGQRPGFDERSARSQLSQNGFCDLTCEFGRVSQLWVGSVVEHGS